MSGTNSHPYSVQDAALFIALIPFMLLLVMMVGARFFDALHRARRPVPQRPPAIVALRARRFAPTPD